MVCQKVVVIRSTAAAPVATISMCSLVVSCVHKTLRHQCPLKCYVRASAERAALVNTPAHRTVVNDDVLLVKRTKTVPSVGATNSYIAASNAETHISYDDIVGAYLERITCNTYTIARCCLSGYSYIWLLQLECGLQLDCSRDIKYDDTFASLVDGISERSNAVVVFKSRDMVNLTSTSSCNITSESFCTRECWCVLCGCCLCK